MTEACHAPVAGTAISSRVAIPTIALVGRPNVGKSTFFAAATGHYAEASNAPGTTIRHERRLTRVDGQDVWLVDLPGTTSLAMPVGDGRPFWSTLLDARPDAIVVVVDAADVGRHLPLVLACRDLGLPVVVAANLADEARARGISLDVGRLSQLLLAPVHRTVGRSGQGVDSALSDAARLGRRVLAVRQGESTPHATVPAPAYPPAIEAELARAAAEIGTSRSLGAAVNGATTFDVARLVGTGVISPRGAASLELAATIEPARWTLGARWGGQVEGRSDTATRGRQVAERLASWSVAPWPGVPIFAVVTAVLMWTMMTVGTVLSGILSTVWEATASPAIGAVVGVLVPDATVGKALLWGLDDGVLSMLSVGVPYILTFYVLLAFLEDSGYLTSVAVLTDRVLGALGLSGRVAIPLLAATGCNVPALYGTRLLGTRRERLVAGFLITMTPCSARIAVISGALVPFAGMGPALAAFGVVAVLTLAGGLLANRIVPGRQSPVVLELAPLRRPILRHVATKAWWRYRSFIRTALPIMVAGSIVLGCLYETNLIWSLAGVLDPLMVGWLGLPSVAGLALVFAFLRKELALQLLATFAIVQLGQGAASIGSFMSPGQLFVYAVVTSVSFPCIATLATLASEFGRRAALAMGGGTIVLALVAGGLIARLLGVA